jgi:predicted RNase H-like HicB family nuclease
MMAPLSNKFTKEITKKENWYVAFCVELGVHTQGKTIAKSQANLKKTVELYLECFGKPP